MAERRRVLRGGGGEKKRVRLPAGAWPASLEWSEVVWLSGGVGLLFS
jgi:hypothetical protein